jgi:benzil reductase ((S)-benzoin forming)
MNYFIITGASQGFGKALVLKLLESKENFVISISRKDPNINANNNLFIKYDLANVLGIHSLMKQIFSFIKSDAVSIHLINNAATVVPMGPLDSCDPEEVIRHFNVNAIAPALISAEVFNFFKKHKCEKGIINISSGASRTAYHGWSCYCSSKASLEMLTQCLVLENPDITIATYDPGVIDTSMQDYIRSQSKEDFKSRDKFLALKENNKLATAADAAEKFATLFFRKYILN